MNIRTALFVLVFAALPATAVAESSSDTDEDLSLVTDRPDVSESSSTVPTNHLQLEAGAAVGIPANRDDTLAALGGFGPTTNVQPLGLLARYGVADIAEIRLSTTPLTLAIPKGGETRTSVFPSIGIGAKVATALNEQLRVGALPWFDILPSEEATAWAAGVLGTASYDVTSTFGLATNIGAGFAAAPFDGGRHPLELRGSLAAAFSLSESTGIYAEYYTILIPKYFDSALAQGDRHGTDAGVTYLVTPTVQLDAYVNTDLPDFRTVTVGVGASFLL